MLKQVLIACLFVATGSIASEARPFRTGQIPECNVTMPCNFSFPPTHRAKVSPYARPSQFLERRAVSDDHSALAEANVPRGQDVGGRPAGCPRGYAVVNPHAT